MQISIGGLPSGASAAVTVSSAQGYQKSVTRADTLPALLAGSYTITAQEVVVGSDRYVPAAPTQLISVAAGPATSVQVAYALVTARLRLTLSGVPAGTSPALLLTGPAGFTMTLHGPAELAGLALGAYTLEAPSLESDGDHYAAQPETRELILAVADTVPVQTEVAYALATGRLIVEVSGVPAGSVPAIQIAGPNVAVTIEQTDTLVGLTPGTYQVTANGLSHGGFSYVASPATVSVGVTANPLPAMAQISYAVSTGALQVETTGLPAGISASVSVTGPSGYFQSLSGSQLLLNLAPGSYTVSASDVVAAGQLYRPTPGLQSKVVASGISPQVATISYDIVAATLVLSVTGLPTGVPANVAVTGPGGFSQNVTQSQSLFGLLAGQYAVEAGTVSSGGTTYVPAPPSQIVSLTGGSTASASVSYTSGGGGGGGGGGLDLTISGAYLIQATQRFDGTVPLVAGRDAYLRVFALASQTNSVQPQVRVRLYSGATLLNTYTLTAPASSVPTAVDESSLLKSWNVLVPAALIQPGLRFLADVDPAGAVAEADETNNQFPVSGVSAAVDVRSLPVFAARLVPVLQQATGLQGNVTAANQDQFLADLRKALPVGANDIELRAPYTTTAPPLQSNDGNGAWSTVLSEILALRSSEASARYYYGVVKVSYTSGVAGLGYVGGNSHAAIGWDYLPSGTHVLAHEVGHNLGRWHAPCGGPSGVDAGYPYPGGVIGVWGLDVAALVLKPPTYDDLMSYCGPNWVSDYNWSGMVSFRQSGPNNAPEADLGAGEGLLIWGRVGPSGVVLEPAFRIPAGHGVLPRPGVNRLELLDGNGAVLRNVRFETAEAADLPNGAEQHFAFVVPVDAALATQVSGFRVTAGSRSATRAATGTTAGDPEVTVTRLDATRVQVRWNGARYPMALVRDAASGEILSFARGGSARLFSRSENLRVQFSDGVKSVTRPVRVLR